MLEELTANEKQFASQHEADMECLLRSQEIWQLQQVREIKLIKNNKISDSKIQTVSRRCKVVIGSGSGTFFH